MHARVNDVLALRKRDEKNEGVKETLTLAKSDTQNDDVDDIKGVLLASMTNPGATNNVESATKELLDDMNETIAQLGTWQTQRLNNLKTHQSESSEKGSEHTDLPNDSSEEAQAVGDVENAAKLQLEQCAQQEKRFRHMLLNSTPGNSEDSRVEVDSGALTLKDWLQKSSPSYTVPNANNDNSDANLDKLMEEVLDARVKQWQTDFIVEEDCPHVSQEEENSISGIQDELDQYTSDLNRILSCFDEQGQTSSKVDSSGDKHNHTPPISILLRDAL